MANALNNPNWTDTDHATHKASLWAARSLYNTLIDAGWEVTESTDKRDELGVLICTVIELLSPEGVAMQVTIEEPEWATEARSN